MAVKESAIQLANNHPLHYMEQGLEYFPRWVLKTVTLGERGQISHMSGKHFMQENAVWKQEKAGCHQ